MQKVKGNRTGNQYPHQSMNKVLIIMEFVVFAVEHSKTLQLFDQQGLSTVGNVSSHTYVNMANVLWEKLRSPLSNYKFCMISKTSEKL